MATFPSLRPSTRTFTPGRHPHSEIPTLSGLQTRVRTSNVLLDQRLRLTFSALTEDQMLSIRNHYLGQQGRFLSFNIPNDLLSGTTNPASFTPTGYSWIYASRPSVTDIGLQRYDVSLELATVPPEGATINGADFTVPITFTPGEGLNINPGANFTVDVTYDSASYLASGFATSTGTIIPVAAVSGKGRLDFPV